MGTHTTSSNRALALDFLRISLCAGVVLYHYTPNRPSIGPFMVIGFLVLSGFLLGMAFQRFDTLNPSTFYAHKCKRFLPMLIAALLFSMVGKFLIGKALLPPAVDFSWGNFSIPLFLEYYSVPIWYMGVELLLLLCAPFFFFLHQTKHGILLFFLACAAFTGLLFSQVPYAAKFGDGLYFSPVARCWQFVAGIVAAQLFSGYYQLPWLSKITTSTKNKICRSVVCLLLIIYAAAWIALAILKQDGDLRCWNYTYSFDFLCTIFYIFLIPLLYQLNTTLSDRAASFIRYAAGLTYPIYLLHTAMLHAWEGILPILGSNSLQLMRLLALLCTLIGALILTVLQKKFIS